MQKNPGTIIAMQWILKFRLLLMACLIAAVGIIGYHETDPTFASRLIQVILKYNAGNHYQELKNSTDLIFYLIGINLIPALILIFEYDLLTRKKVIGFWILFTLDFLAGLATRILFFQVIILILALLKSSRIYFHTDKKRNLTNILDQDILNETN